MYFILWQQIRFKISAKMVNPIFSSKNEVHINSLSEKMLGYCNLKSEVLVFYCTHIIAYRNSTSGSVFDGEMCPDFWRKLGIKFPWEMRCFSFCEQYFGYALIWYGIPIHIVFQHLLGHSNEVDYTMDHIFALFIEVKGFWRSDILFLIIWCSSMISFVYLLPLFSLSHFSSHICSL